MRQYFQFTKCFIILFYILQTIKGYFIPPGNHNNVTLHNFSFGSCFYGRESERLDIFKTVLKNSPQMWFWIGDAAYVDVNTVLYYWKSTLEVNFTEVEKIFNIAKSEESI